MSYRFKVGDRFYVVRKHSFLTGKIGTVVECKNKWSDMKAYVMVFEGVPIKCHIEECILIKEAIKC